MSWTVEDEQQLRRLWADGLSASAIGAELGKPRNAVLGKVHRLHLSPRAPSGGPKSRKSMGTELRPDREAKPTKPAAPKPRAPVAATAATKPAPLPGISAAGGTVRTMPKGQKPANNCGAIGIATGAPPRPPRVDLLAAYPLTETAVPIFDSGMTRCKWPLWSGRERIMSIPEAERLCCGAPIDRYRDGNGHERTSPWCAHHRWIADSASARGRPMPPETKAAKREAAE